MRELFTTERAREQVRRILEYVAAPGFACVLDEWGTVLAAAGAVADMDAAAVARVFGLRDDGLVAPRQEYALARGGLVAWSRELTGDRRLLVVLPPEIGGVTRRMDRAAELLERMLRRAPGSLGSPPAAHAVVFAAPPIILPVEDPETLDTD